MQLHSKQSRSCACDAVLPTSRHLKRHWGKVLACLAVLVTLAGSAQQSQQGLNPSNRWSDLDDQLHIDMRGPQAKQQSIEAANAARKKQLTEDSAKLLALAVALKADVDKTSKDMLSLSVIRKADEIEKLAHNVKEKMKVTVGGS